jgi:hypothetical protein
MTRILIFLTHIANGNTMGYTVFSLIAFIHSVYSTYLSGFFPFSGKLKNAQHAFQKLVNYVRGKL